MPQVTTGDRGVPTRRIWFEESDTSALVDPWRDERFGTDGLLNDRRIGSVG